MSGKYILVGHDAIYEPDLHKWARWLETADTRVKETISLDCRVSTVFLGLDHNYGYLGLPLIFETMVFGGEKGGEMERYSTWQEAEEGHDRMVVRCRNENNSVIVNQRELRGGED